MADRTPMLEVDWFRSYGHLAIADVVYVEGLGVCSHQPIVDQPLVAGEHRMMDACGNIHIVKSEQLFEATFEEMKHYWGSINNEQTEKDQ